MKAGTNEIHSLVSDVQHDMMDGTNHWMQLDDPEGFNRILDRFLEQIEESR